MGAAFSSRAVKRRPNLASPASSRTAYPAQKGGIPSKTIHAIKKPWLKLNPVTSVRRYRMIGRAIAGILTAASQRVSLPRASAPAVMASTLAVVDSTDTNRSSEIAVPRGTPTPTGMGRLLAIVSARLCKKLWP